MKRLFFLLPLLFVSSAFAPAGEDEGWSAPVKGLRGRLSFGKEENFNGIRLPVVFMELENVSNTPLDIFSNSTKFEVADGTGKPLPKPPMADASIMVPSPWWFTLPALASLRFRVSVSGYGVMPGTNIALQLPDDLYIFQADDKSAYFLSGAFTNTNHEPADLDALRAFRKEHRLPWYGTLQLPKIKIPIAAPTPAQ